MGKQKKQLLALLIVMVVVIAGYVGLRLYNNQQTSKDNSNTTTVLEIPEDSIQSITYDYNDVTYELLKDGENWTYPADETVDIDETKMSQLLLAVDSISTDKVIENVENLEEYGLVNPSRTVSVNTTDGKTYTVLMGDINEVINAYYFCLEGENTVYTMQGYHFTNFDKTPWDLAVEEETTSEETVSADTAQ